MNYSSGDFELPKKLAILTILRDLYDISTRNKLTHYTLELDIMNYFEAQNIIAVLIEDECIDAFLHDGLEYIKINDKGLSFLEALASQIPASWREPLELVTKNAISTNSKGNTNSVKGKAVINKIGDREFLLMLEIIDEFSSLLHLKITVFSEKQANKIALNWKKDPIKAYENIVQSLTQ